MQSSHKESKRTCPQCQFVNPRGKTRCKKCAADLSIQPERPPLPEFLRAKRSIPLTSIIPIVAIGGMLVFGIFMLVRGPDYSLPLIVSRGNRVIAIERASRPGYRWVLSSPSSYQKYATGAVIPEPSTLHYGTGWSHGPPFLAQETTKLDLTLAEWQIMDGWRIGWCANADIAPAAASDGPYTVVLRCGSDSKIIYVWREQIPGEVLTLLDRIAQMHP